MYIVLTERGANDYALDIEARAVFEGTESRWWIDQSSRAPSLFDLAGEEAITRKKRENTSGVKRALALCPNKLDRSFILVNVPVVIML